ncbi:MAG TPA: peptidase [Thermomonospora sp.]|nr:peptidase [Thermomonospora sp.]
MQAPLRGLVLSALGTATLAATVVVPASAVSASVSASPVPRPHARVLAATPAAQERLDTLWTRARMRSAVPMERLLSPGAVPRRGAVAPEAFPDRGSAWTRGGEVVKTTGRVFFTHKGRAASCSGSAVVSQNRSTVITAGHCVKLEGSWHTDWIFVPGYHNGNAPYGKWTARKTLATAQWSADEAIQYDIGAAVLNPLDGRQLTDVVGGRAIAFDQPKRQAMYSFGYPAAAPYDGTKLTYCSGTTTSSFLLGTLGMACTMTGGSSGGPWLSGFDEATGTGAITSVNSYKLNLPFLNGNMYGPYFGADARALYEQAQTA